MLGFEPASCGRLVKDQPAAFTQSSKPSRPHGQTTPIGRT